MTTSEKLAADVLEELKVRVAATKHSTRIREALSGIQSAIVLVDSIAQGLDVVNAYAAEHLEIQTKNAAQDALQIRNAGAVFIGRFAQVSLGGLLSWFKSRSAYWWMCLSQQRSISADIFTWIALHRVLTASLCRYFRDCDHSCKL